MHRQSPLRGPIHAALIAVSLLTAVSRADHVPDGYWTPRTPEDYEVYIRIKGNTGFHCVLDGKSSFRFTVVGDSITTPMNGMNALVWYPGSGDIVISGEEKGEPYSTRYKETDSATYAAKCADEEANLPVAAKPHRARAFARPSEPVANRDALGRKAVRPQRPGVSGTAVRFPSPRT